MADQITLPNAQTALRSHGKSQPAHQESVAAILKRCKADLIADWLERAKRTPELSHLHLGDEERTGHLPKLVDDIVTRLVKHELPSKDSDSECSIAALEHGLLRREQHYTPAMLIHESRILQVTIFGTLQKISVLDFNLPWLDVMIIADEVDAQLTQTMESFTNGSPALEKTHLHLLKANG
jgi:hypothetical protein